LIGLEAPFGVREALKTTLVVICICVIVTVATGVAFAVIGTECSATYDVPSLTVVLPAPS
jgi:hypothetical protein